jgi:hypothetical protein
MKESKITSETELDAALAGKKMHKREKLWKVAEGRSFRWPDVVGLICGALLIVVGIKGVFDDIGPISVIYLVAGMFGFAGGLYRHQQSQIDALRELLKQRYR